MNKTAAIGDSVYQKSRAFTYMSPTETNNMQSIKGGEEFVNARNEHGTITNIQAKTEREANKAYLTVSSVKMKFPENSPYNTGR